MVQESAVEAAAKTTMEKLETAVSGTINTAKELIREGLGVVSDTIDQMAESLMRGGGLENVSEIEDLRTQEEKFKAGLHKVSF